MPVLIALLVYARTTTTTATTRCRMRHRPRRRRRFQRSRRRRRRRRSRPRRPRCRPLRRRAPPRRCRRRRPRPRRCRRRPPRSPRPRPRLRPPRRLPRPARRRGMCCRRPTASTSSSQPSRPTTSTAYARGSPPAMGLVPEPGRVAEGQGRLGGDHRRWPRGRRQAIRRCRRSAAPASMSMVAKSSAMSRSRRPTSRPATASSEIVSGDGDAELRTSGGFRAPRPGRKASGAVKASGEGVSPLPRVGAAHPLPAEQADHRQREQQRSDERQRPGEPPPSVGSTWPRWSRRRSRS